MVLKLTEDDHNELDKYISGILDLYRLGQTTRVAATAELAEAFTMLAKGNEGFYKYIRIPTEKRKLERDPNA